MIDVHAVRESYERIEINDVAWIPSRANPADALTKLTSNAVLDKILENGIVEHEVGQWILRTPDKSQLSQPENGGV